LQYRTLAKQASVVSVSVQCNAAQPVPCTNPAHSYQITRDYTQRGSNTGTNIPVVNNLFLWCPQASFQKPCQAHNLAGIPRPTPLNPLFSPVAPNTSLTWRI